MGGSEESIYFMPEGKKVAFCAGAHGHWRHNLTPVILFIRPSKIVRRGVCKACGRIFVSLISVGEEEE